MNTIMPADAAISDLAIDHLAPGARLGAQTRGLRDIPHLPAFFGDRPIGALGRGCDAAIGWGSKPSGQAAASFGRQTGRPFVLLEDGFLRSVGLGKTGAATVSVVVDDCGIYYDARRPSRLERLLSSRAFDHPAIASATGPALARWLKERLSKYNIGPDTPSDAARGKIILVDQVQGDLSVAGAGGDPATFRAMIAEARRRDLFDRIVVRAHPDVLAGKARGYLLEAAREAGVPVMADDCTPAGLLDTAAAIWTVSSGLGFEAILRGVPVVTFGMPFYAGFGVSEDLADNAVAQAARARRQGLLRPEEVFAAVFLLYARYADPVTRRRIDFDGAVDRILDWRMRDAEKAGPPLYAFGFSHWKQPNSTAMLGGNARKVSYCGKARARNLKSIPTFGAREIAVWGHTEDARFRDAVARQGLSIRRVEDGFLRSVGLGSDILGPGSLVFDDAHLYFEAAGESRLERILATTEFSEPLRLRAAALARRIVERALTKYNLGTVPDAGLRAKAGGRRIIAVVEQVPGDQAIRLGGGIVEPNLGLLEAVRQANPQAFIAYKEHPDLVSGNRRGRTPKATLDAYADIVLSAGDLGALYAEIDELHVITSLAGFEALLRGVPVTTWGVPFYAGWGLTRDMAAMPRRTRLLSLPELVAGTLILYPSYVEPESRVPCSVEDFLDVLERQRAAARPAGFGRQVIRLFRYVEGYLKSLRG